MVLYSCGTIAGRAADRDTEPWARRLYIHRYATNTAAKLLH